MTDGEPHRILLIDDDPEALRLLESHLTSGGHQVLTATNGAEAMQILLSEGPPMVITDWMMPKVDGLELCRRIHSHEGIAFVYIIVVTAHSDEDRIVEALDAGADDCISKPFRRKELLARVRAGSRVIQLRADLDRRNREVHRFNAEMALAHSKLHDANEKLRHMATTDELTGLTNRRASMQRLAEHWMSASRHSDALACIMLDIDHFKGINDTYGHAVGDLVLKETAGVLRRKARTEEQVCRIGGEEFLVICPRTTESEAAIAAERLCRSVEENKIDTGAHQLSVTISLGVAERRPAMLSPDDLLAVADRALYTAKRDGRNIVRLASRCERETAPDEDAHDDLSAEPPSLPACAGPEDTLYALVVASDVQLRKACRKLLEQEGYAVREAPDQRSALESIGQASPSMIVTASGKSGGELAERVRAFKKHPGAGDSIVLVITEEGGSTKTGFAFAAGADECVSQEVLARELPARVRSAVRGRGLRKELSSDHEMRGEQSLAMNLLLDFSRDLVSLENLDDVLEKTVLVTAQLSCSRRVSVMLPDPQRRHLLLAHSIGIERSRETEIRVPVGAGICGRVFQSGEPVVGNKETDLELRDQRYDSDFFVSAPLISKALTGSEYTVGVLNVSDRLGRKPFGPFEIECIDLVCNIAAAAIHERLTRRSRDDARDSIVIALATLAEYRDSDTGRHVDRVAHFCRIIAEELRSVEQYREVITDQFISDIQRAAPLHDIGKVAVPDSILFKPGPLSDEEIVVMRAHAAIGATTIRSVNERVPGAGFLKMAEEIAHAHHEWYDGTGYPRGLCGDDIPLSARIAAVADVYDALTTRRSYKDAMPHTQALEIICSSKGVHFHPDVVEAFRRRQKDFSRLATELADNAVPRTAPDRVYKELPTRACTGAPAP
ncbi:MAG: diguanylate cyclase [Phycisphaerae bacterium]